MIVRTNFASDLIRLLISQELLEEVGQKNFLSE